MITLLVRWFSIVLVSWFLLPVIGWVHTPPESLSQIHNVFLPLIKNDPILMAYVPQGEFMMGCYPAPGDCYIDDDHLHSVYLDSYWIDKFEVTNAQFAKCVAGGSCAPPGNFSSNTHPNYYDNPTFANYPMINSTWEDAQNYCLWSGMRLPTEAEWEKAARGSDLRFFPWGNQMPDCTMANYYDVYANQYCVNDTTLVGSYPLSTSPYGLSDMAGNVAEWVSDWYDPEYYHNSPYVNPVGPSSGTEKVLRGGGWNNNWRYLQVTDRWPQDPGSIYNFVGFRCVFTP